ncbi:hypothetical protein M2133_001352 [Parabacteroides sp. PF5-6]|nr:hypothetical protein [Parabacteroides sp. PF5-6]
MHLCVYSNPESPCYISCTSLPLIAKSELKYNSGDIIVEVLNLNAIDLYFYV